MSDDPPALVISMEEARRQLRLESDDESQDEEISGFIRDAQDWVETYTGHLLTPRDVTQDFDGFGAIRLRAWPIATDAAVAVTYLDASGQVVDVSNVSLSVASRPGRLVPAVGNRFPVVPRGTVVSVTVRAGYENPTDIPGNFHRAMLLLISAYDDDREGGDTLAKAEAIARRLCGWKRWRGL